MPEADPFRDLRGKNKPAVKRKNPRIVELVDELLSEPKATAPKVRRALRRHGFIISLSTIYRIANDLTFKWTKPWHTDILTPAQKLKRKLFCFRLLQLTDEALLRIISRWMFTDEKWWDIVGPAASKYCKGKKGMERKLQNQVHFFFTFACWPFLIATSCTHDYRSPGTKAKRVASKRGFTSGVASRGTEKLRESRGRQPTSTFRSDTPRICAWAPSSWTRTTMAIPAFSESCRPARLVRIITSRMSRISTTPTPPHLRPSGCTLTTPR